MQCFKRGVLMAKKIDKEKLEWLNEELRDLSGQGLIEESVAQMIRGHYEAADEEPALQPAQVTEPAPQVGGVKKARTAAGAGKQQYALIVLVLLGVFMIGSGVVLLFAHNWDMLSIHLRVAIAFIPVILAACCGVYTIVKEKDSRWQEASAFFTATGFAVLTALISQIYHTGGTMIDFSKLIMMVSLPLVYIFRSYLLTVAYCLFLFVFIGYSYHDVRDVELLYFAGIAPFIIYNLFFHKPAGMRTVWMRYICLLPLFWLLARFSDISTESMNYLAAAGLLYIAGLHYSENKQGGWRNPWLACGWLILTIFLLFATSLLNYYIVDSALSNLWFVFLAAGVLVTTRRVTPLKIAILIVLLLPVVMMKYDLWIEFVAWGANICLLVIGATALWEGAKERGIVKVNAGMLQIALLTLVKFADERMSILVRALIFIAVGIAFIIVNIYLSRKFRVDNAFATSESEVQNDVEK